LTNAWFAINYIVLVNNKDIMTLTFDEDTKLLVRLGLTELQAQIYLTLAKMDKATLRDLSAAAKTDRANAYRVITRLQELNLIEKLLANPTMFRALPLDEGIKMLLEKKDQEHNDIKAKTRALLTRYKNAGQNAMAEDVSQFILVPDGRLTKRKVAEMVNSNQKTHDILIYWSDFKHQAKSVAAMWNSVLLRGIRVRIIVFLEEDERLPKVILCLCKNPLFEVRQASGPPKVTLSIIDGKETLISVTPSISPRGKPGLYVHNHGVVGLVQEYFELAWRDSKAIAEPSI
jgi:sugar-specific transcriptional regulator TrmB